MFYLYFIYNHTYTVHKITFDIYYIHTYIYIIYYICIIYIYIIYVLYILYIYIYMCVCVSLLGKLVMCCRYSCQNGHAILAQVFPVLNDLWRNLLCLSFAIMTAMEATSPLASESATLDSISLADAASSTGEDFSHA